MLKNRFLCFRYWWPWEMDHTVSYIPILACHLLPVVLFGLIVMRKQYRKSHVLLLSNILRISEFYHCMYQTTTIKRKLHQTYILGVTFWFCLLQSITLIWPYLETSLKFLHKSMDFSFVEHEINYSKSKSLVALDSSNPFGWIGVWSLIYMVDFFLLPLTPVNLTK